MKRKWREIANDISENKQREITIEDVEKRARSASHPILEDILPPKQYQGKPQKFANNPLRAPGRAAASGISEDSKRIKHHAICLNVLCVRITIGFQGVMNSEASQ